MMDYLLDTDIFSLWVPRHPFVQLRIAQHQQSTIGLTIINIEEIWSGWKGLLNRARTDAERVQAYERLTRSQRQLLSWPIVTFSLAAFQQLEQLRKQKLNIGANDQKIAAIALTLNATVVTRNVRDFSRVPNLKIGHSKHFAY